MALIRILRGNTSIIVLPYILIQIKDGEYRMKLPNGITGIYNSDAIKPPSVNGKQFKQLCYEIVSCNGGSRTKRSN